MATIPFPESPKGDVLVLGEAVTITDLVVVDPELVEIVRQAPEGRRLELIERALRLGLIAVGSDMTAQLRESMLFFERTLDQQVSAFTDRLSERVRDQLGDPGEDGQVQQRIREIMSQWAIELKADFEKTLPAIFDGQTQRSVERIEAEGDRVIKQIVGLFSEDGLALNVLRDIKLDFAQRLEEIKARPDDRGESVAAGGRARLRGCNPQAARDGRGAPRRRCRERLREGREGPELQEGRQLHPSFGRRR